MQQKTPSFTLVVTIFVMMPLIVLQALLVLLDFTTLELPSMLGSIFLWHEISLEFLNSLQKARPKDAQFFSQITLKFPCIKDAQMTCLSIQDDSLRFYKPKPDIKRLQRTFTKNTKIMPLSHPSHEPQMCAFLICKDNDFKKNPSIPTKSEPIKDLNLIMHLNEDHGLINVCFKFLI